MRKKIGKRIGPVPIALVAVLALAAFISAGFWLVPYSAYAQAQGLPVIEPSSGTCPDVGEMMTPTVRTVNSSRLGVRQVADDTSSRRNLMLHRSDQDDDGCSRRIPQSRGSASMCTDWRPIAIPPVQEDH